MKKSLTTLLIIASCSFFAFSQEDNTSSDFWGQTEPETTSLAHSTYLGISSGINNINGLLGFNIESQVANKLSFIGAVGLGGWGYKLSGGIRHYNSFPKRFFLGAALSYHSGINEFKMTMQNNSYSGDSYLVKFNPSLNLPLSFGYQGTINNDKIRFHFELGYSIRLHSDGWELIDEGVVLNEEESNALNILIPGGLIIGAGMSFAIF